MAVIKDPGTAGTGDLCFIVLADLGVSSCQQPTTIPCFYHGIVGSLGGCTASKLQPGKVLGLNLVAIHTLGLCVSANLSGTLVQINQGAWRRIVLR